MTIEELEAECRRCIELGRDVQLVVPRKFPPSGRNIRLGNRWGPLSTEIANVQKRGQDYLVCAWWDPQKVLDWIADE